MLNSTDLVLRLIALFDRLAIPYMLVGSYSSNYYGRPRLTKDADFVVVVSAEQLSGLSVQLGPDFHMDTQASFETVTMTRRHVIIHPATAFKLELFALTDDAHDQERFRRRQVVDFEGHPVRLPTAEDVIVQKLRWGRPKDLEDVRDVLAVQMPVNLDMAYVSRWCEVHGTSARLSQLLAEIEPLL